MALWGLTDSMRALSPWDIPPEALAPCKVITDPVHGDIGLTQLETAIVNSATFQRLRRVRQLGTVHLVYPGATHTRFAHSLGTLAVAQGLFDIVLAQRDSRHQVEDLFLQWSNESEELHDRKVAEAMVLARLGALMHDMCHVPFSHSLEDDLGVLPRHDSNQRRFKLLWKGLGDRVVGLLEADPELKKELEPLILSKDSTGETKDPTKLRYPFVSDIVGNTISADLLDYLQRDHMYTGLPLALGERYKSTFFVTPARDELLYPQRMALAIHRNGRERRDVVGELVKHLRYRYELQERVFTHHAKLAADAMVGKLLELWHEHLWLTEAFGAAAEADNQTLVAGKAKYREANGNRAVTRLNAKVRNRVEDHLLSCSDDALLEGLRRSHADQLKQRRGTAVSQRRRGIAELSDALLNRHLYARIATASGAFDGEALYRKFHSPAKRQRLQRAACAFAEYDPDWHVIIWLPRAPVGLKLAEMIVDHGRGLAPLHKYSQTGSDIYQAHRELWTITVFAHRKVLTDGAGDAILARLAADMDVCWDTYGDLLGQERLGRVPGEWPHRLAALEAMGLKGDDRVLNQLIATERSMSLRAGRHLETPRTLMELRDRYKSIAESLQDT